GFVGIQCGETGVKARPGPRPRCAAPYAPLLVAFPEPENHVMFSPGSGARLGGAQRLSQTAGPIGRGTWPPPGLHTQVGTGVQRGFGCTEQLAGWFRSKPAAMRSNVAP